MRTVVALENSSCARCHNALLAALREKEHVQRVWSDFSAGCLVIEHEDDPDALVSVVRAAGRAVAVAASGQRVMVSLDGHEEAECQMPEDTAGARQKEGLATALVTSAVGGATRSAARPAPGPVRWAVRVLAELFRVVFRLPSGPR